MSKLNVYKPKPARKAKADTTSNNYSTSNVPLRNQDKPIVNAAKKRLQPSAAPQPDSTSGGLTR